MDTQGLSESDVALIDAARAVVERQYVRGWNTVGAAIRTAGDTYSAIHLDADVGRIAVCAEAIALGMAVSNGDRSIEAVVAVAPDGDGWTVLPPCGMCREMLSDYAPGAYAIVPLAGDRLVRRRVPELLPDKWYRAERHPALDSPGVVGKAPGIQSSGEQSTS